MEQEGKTHFGFQTIDKDKKASRVAEVFDSVATNYDLMNDVLSVGIHRIWKKLAIEYSGVTENFNVLDVAGGTGDLSLAFAKKVGNSGRVILSDINSNMLNIGRDKILNKGLLNVDFVCCDAENLPFASNTFDVVSIGFGLRNVTNKEKALESMFKVLKPKGKLLILEFSKPTNNFLSKIYDFYSFNFLPFAGKMIAKDKDSYKYLAESIRMHPNQQKLKQMLEVRGFTNVQYHNLTGGIVALHIGTKP